MKKQNGILPVCAFAFGSNLILFFIKLYVGLSTNSISIFSDAVNNLFDSLSGLLTFICLAAVMKEANLFAKSIVTKAEQLLSFIMSVIVAFAGFYFAYSSVERLMYPTPVWYTEKYLLMLILTAAAKIAMWLVYRIWSKTVTSPVVKVMSVDCILDFFITSVTVLTLFLSKNGSYSFDAIFGIVISTVIVVSAVKMMISQAGKLINYVSLDKRQAVENALKTLSDGINTKNVTYYSDEEHTEAYIKIESSQIESEKEKLEQVKIDCRENADIEVFFISV